MKKIILYSCVSLFLVVLLIVLAKNKDGAKLGKKEKAIPIETLREGLESDRIQERMEPFAQRKFDPYLSGKWIGNAVSYGCYRSGQEPGKRGPSEEEILQDLTIVQKYWNLIRVYNADDDTERILKVISEHKLPVRMMLGIWLANETDHPEQKNVNIENVLRGIELANRFKDIVIAINVGNETQVYWSWHKMDVHYLINYIRTIRRYTDQPVTTADDYNFWNKPEAAAVADEVDFIVTHIYPLWNGQTLRTAIDWMDSTFKDIVDQYPDMQIVLGETGWATEYNADKKGPGEEGTLIKGEIGLAAQEKYLLLHNDWVNNNRVTTFLFEAFDEPWKGGGESSEPNVIEKHWGVFYADRTPKASFLNYLKSQAE